MVVLRAEGGRQGPATDPRFEQLSDLVIREMTAEHIPGVAFGVLKTGQIQMRGFGVTNIDDPQAVTPQTLFALASISKTVTATAVMSLVEQGAIDLDAPVRRYIPEFQVRDEAASRSVTIRHLLTHTPGWEGQLIVPDRGTRRWPISFARCATFPTGATRRRLELQQRGIHRRGRVIEVVTGKPFQDALSDLVFRPAQLSSARPVSER
jgi:CubicO group peptidase (beta-lactamase class C family)